MSAAAMAGPRLVQGETHRREPRWTLHHGEALALLKSMPDASVDAVITDPPYSSGGFTRGDRTASTTAKYTLTGTQIERPAFAGDNRDQRSFGYWCALWLSECLRVAKAPDPQPETQYTPLAQPASAAASDAPASSSGTQVPGTSSTLRQQSHPQTCAPTQWLLVGHCVESQHRPAVTAAEMHLCSTHGW
jgi:hypothetical protein